MKRLFDILVSGLGLLGLAPVVAVALLLVFFQDGRSPLYIGSRVGRGGRRFRMYKIRSMIVDADRNGVESTSANDRRITAVGAFIRRWKLDEIPQLINVLKGDMSMVGPRPNTVSEVATYTPSEHVLLSVRPGITDMSSIVFADEGEILRHASDPQAVYRELIWPWKSRLGLFYVAHQSIGMDVRLVSLTLLSAVSRRRALDGVRSMLIDANAPDALVRVSARDAPLAGLSANLPGAADRNGATTT